MSRGNFMSQDSVSELAGSGFGIGKHLVHGAACALVFRAAKHGKRKKGLRHEPQTRLFIGGPSGTRTPNQLIKSQLLYQLS